MERTHSRTMSIPSTPLRRKRLVLPSKRDVLIAVCSAAVGFLWRNLDLGDRSVVLIQEGDTLGRTLNVNFFGPSLSSQNEAVPVTAGHAVSSLSAQTDIMPSTNLVAHGDGWSIWDNLYMFNGTLLAISDEGASNFPSIRMLTSTGLPAENDAEGKTNAEAREPTSYNMDMWDRAKGQIWFGHRIHNVSGASFLINDPPQFLDHYYHFAAEMLLGLWRMYVGHLDPHVGPRGETSLPDPARVIFMHSDAKAWKDKYGFNQYFLHASFPSLSLESQPDWEDRIRMTRGVPGLKAHKGAGGTAKAWRFDRVVLADRSASFRGQAVGRYTQRTVAAAFVSNREVASENWWEPIRRRVLSFAQVSQEILDYSLAGTQDATLSSGSRYRASSEQPESNGVSSADLPPVQITYVSRQGWRRRLIDEHHRELVSAVESLCSRKGWRFLEFYPEKYSVEEQLAIAAQTTVMLGVHGNGLTHLIAMPRTPVSTVVEIFYPNGFARDYQWTAEALGHKHYGIWNDTHFTSPALPDVNYPEGFQGTQIPVHGQAVANLIEERIAGKYFGDRPRPCEAENCSFNPPS